MSDYGLGVVISMRDLFSNTANRVGSAVRTLDKTVAAASERLDRNMERMQQGMIAVGAGISALAIPAGLLASYGDTQAALGTLASLGVQNLASLEAASEKFTNQWSGYSKGEFIRAAYDVRSALSGLSDEATGAFTANAALTAKATKASIQEMVGAFTTGYGVYKPLLTELSDMEFGQAFSGAMAQTVKSFKTNGKELADAIKNLGAVAANNLTPLEEQLAILGTLQTTMPGGESGTLYKSFALRATEAGRKLGLAFTDAQGHMLGIVPILETIQRRFPDLANGIQKDQLKSAFGDEGFKFVTSMITGLEPLRANIQAIRTAMKTGTREAEQMATAMNGGIQAMTRLVGQQARNLAEILGKTLVPVFTPIARGASNLLLTLQSMAKAAPNVTRGVLVAAAALGSALVIVGGLISAVGFIGVIVPGIQIGLAAIGTAATTTLGLVAAYAWPVTLAFAGLAAVVGVVRAIWQQDLGGIRTAVESLWSKVQLFVTGTSALFSTLANGTGQISADLAKQLQTAGLWEFAVGTFRLFYRAKRVFIGFAEGIKNGLAAVANRLGPSLEVMRVAVGSLLDAFGRLFAVISGTGNSLTGLQFEDFGRLLGTSLTWVLDSLVPILGAVVKTVAAVVNSVATVIDVFARAHQATSRFSQKAALVFYDILQPFRWVMGVLERVQNRTETVSTKVSNAFQRLTQSAKAAGLLSANLFFQPWLVMRLLPKDTFHKLKSAASGTFGSLFTQVRGNLRVIGNAFRRARLNFEKVPIAKKFVVWTKAAKTAAHRVSQRIRTAFNAFNFEGFLVKMANSFAKAQGIAVLLGRGLGQAFKSWGASLGKAFNMNPFETVQKFWGLLVTKVQAGLTRLRRIFNTLIPRPFTNLIGRLTGQTPKAMNHQPDKLARKAHTYRARWIPQLEGLPQALTGGSAFKRSLSVVPRLAGTVPSQFSGQLKLRATPPRIGESVVPQPKKIPVGSLRLRVAEKPDRTGKLELVERFPVIPTPAHNRESASSRMVETLVAEIAALKEAIKAQNNQPIALNLTTQIDGREVTRTVVENLRQQKTRNYQ